MVRPGDENDPSEKGLADASLEWAYLKYLPTSSLAFRVGRLRLPAYYYSESYNVGYSYPWVRLPIELYTQVPLTSYNGVDLTYHGVHDDYFYQVRGIYGESEGLYKSVQEPDFEIGFSPSWGVVFSGGTNAFQLSLNYIQGKMDSIATPYAPLIDALSQTPYASLAREIGFDGKVGRYYGLGFSYATGPLEFLGEWGKADADTAMHNYDSWFLHAGYHTGDFTPYLVYSETNLASGDRIRQNPIPAAGELAPLYEALEEIGRVGDFSQKTWSPGLRYDFRENMALKIQYDHTDMASASSGFALPRSSHGDGALDIFSVAVHFVFGEAR